MRKLLIVLLLAVVPLTAYSKGQIYNSAKSAYIMFEPMDKASMKVCGLTYEKLHSIAEKSLQRSGIPIAKDSLGDIWFYVNITLKHTDSFCVASFFVSVNTSGTVKTDFMTERTRREVQFELDSVTGIIYGPSSVFSKDFPSFLQVACEKLSLRILEETILEKRAIEGLEQIIRSLPEKNDRKRP